MSHEPIRIAEAGELFAVLESDDIAVRRAARGAVVISPEKALSYGADDGRDVIDVLTAMLKGARGPERLELLQALCRFDDERTVELFKRELREAEDIETSDVAAERLLRLDPAALGAYPSELAQDDHYYERAWAGARLLERRTDLDLRDRLRVALVLEHSDPPALTADTRAAWIFELEGQFCDRARDRLSPEPTSAVAQLACRWDELSTDTRRWLLELGRALEGEQLDTLMLRALGDEDDQVVADALLTVVGFGDRPIEENVARLVRCHLANPRPALRQLAILAAPDDGDWEQILDQEADPDCRAAVVSRLGDELETHSDRLVELLEDCEWRVRGAARDALAKCERPPREAVERLAGDSRSGVAACAAQLIRPSEIPRPLARSKSAR